MTEEVNLKALTEEIINKFIQLIDEVELRNIIERMVSKEYYKGLEAAEKDFNMNFTPEYRTLEFIKKFSFDNVTKLTLDVKDNLRREVSLGLMNRESPSHIRSRIRDVMDTSIERAKMIQVTESNRAANTAHYEGARSSGLDLVKRWDAQPERVSRAGNSVPCKHCEFLDGKVVEMDDKFVDDQGLEFFLPPHHPNCACRVVYVQREDLEK